MIMDVREDSFFTIAFSLMSHVGEKDFEALRVSSARFFVVRCGRQHLGNYVPRVRLSLSGTLSLWSISLSGLMILGILVLTGAFLCLYLYHE